MSVDDFAQLSQTNKNKVAWRQMCALKSECSDIINVVKKTA